MGKRGKMAKIKAAFYSSLEQELANERTSTAYCIVLTLVGPVHTKTMSVDKVSKTIVLFSQTLFFDHAKKKDSCALIFCPLWLTILTSSGLEDDFVVYRYDDTQSHTAQKRFFLPFLEDFFGGTYACAVCILQK